MFKCSLERLLLVGEGQGQAGKRRQWARREEVLRRRRLGGTGRRNDWSE